MHPQHPALARLGIACLLGLSTLGVPAPAIAQGTSPEPEFAPADQRFDLILYGYDFDPGEHEVLLRTNPDFGSRYVSLGTFTGQGGDGQWTSLVLSDLSARRFLGHDFREMYVDLRLVPADGGDGARLAGVYVVPHVDGLVDHVPQVNRLIEQEPLRIERVSLARHVRPTPAELRPGTVFVQYIRAPMKHTLPGVAEVQQLQVEWRNRGN